MPIGDVPDSVRGLTRVQYPSRVSVKGYGGWWKACPGTKRTVEVKQTPGRGAKIDPTKALGRETTKSEGRGLLERCVMVRKVPTGSNMQ